MTHAHPHHDHHKPGQAAASNRVFLVSMALNLLYVLVEVVYGLWANSLALLADAGHNFSDVLGLGLAWAAVMLARRPPSARFTYGLGGSTILAALANSMLLLVAVGGIGVEAIRRFQQPAEVSETAIIVVALIGVVIDIATALVLLRGQKHDLNQRAAYWHMIADAAVSVGVVLAGIGMLLTGWLWLDPAISLLIAVSILAGTWGVFKQSLRLSLQAVPDDLEASAVEEFLCTQGGVADVHDLHIWAMSTTGTALTVHLVMANGHPGDGFLQELARELEQRFGISHTTVQIELGDSHTLCQLAPRDIV